MQIHWYNNYSIVAPPKCGTRYLDKVFGPFESTNEVAGLSIFKNNLYIPSLKTIVIRPPIEHISSAIHTEILGICAGYVKKDISFENYNNLNIDITNMLKTFEYTKQLDKKFNQAMFGCTHWDCTYYERVYWYWRRNHNYVNVIELNNLSSHLKELKIKKLPKFNKSDYDFNGYDYWCDKEDLMLFIKINYEELWDNLMRQIDYANVFYNYLINKEIIEIKLI